MARLRRCTAVFASLLTLQLVLIGGGFGCTMPGMRGGNDAMTRMGMAGGVPAADQKVPAQHHERAPCNLPWAPGGCTGIALCTPAVIPSASVMLLPLVALDHGAVRLVVLAPQSRTIPPELPPPRA